MYLLSNKIIEDPLLNNYTNLTYYIDVIPFSDRLEHFKGLCEYLANKDYYTRYIKSYISTLYKCHKPGLIDPRKLGFKRALECGLFVLLYNFNYNHIAIIDPFFKWIINVQKTSKNRSF